MRSLLVVVVFGLFAAACGKQIGDECIIASDCSPNGDRICLDPAVHKGYCTIQGCDYNTCPEASECVRFFTGGFTNRTCTVQTDCSLDELCSLRGQCVPRSSETRYCMATCESNGDCRDGYECRTLELMKAHGGEPVLTPGTPLDDKSPKFCATAL